MHYTFWMNEKFEHILNPLFRRGQHVTVKATGEKGTIMNITNEGKADYLYTVTHKGKPTSTYSENEITELLTTK